MNLNFTFMMRVFGDTDRDTVKSVSVTEGDSVTLNTGLTEIQKADEMLWKFGPNRTLIDKINHDTGVLSTYDGSDGRFRDRLNQTGSLTIESIGTKHSGLYEVDISNSSSRYTTHKTFNLTVSVKKGYSVTLQINVTEIQKDDQILWMFEDIVIAEIDEAAKLFYIYDGPDGRFRDRLKLDNQTGSLTITNTCTTGLYEQKISSRRHAIKRRFTVIVTAYVKLYGGWAKVAIITLIKVKNTMAEEDHLWIILLTNMLFYQVFTFGIIFRHFKNIII
uniref:Immunoglobulin domain-containing protein n=1 Tax=Cyprinus carpio TaxID=7962 RepID=A0A8C2E3P7_CYPCA